MFDEFAVRLLERFGGEFTCGSRERCKAIVSVSGYLITNRKATLKPLAPKAELGWWYQYYFATENGVLGYTQTGSSPKLIWTIVSPKLQFDDASLRSHRSGLQQPRSRCNRDP